LQAEFDAAKQQLQDTQSALQLAQREARLADRRFQEERAERRRVSHERLYCGRASKYLVSYYWIPAELQMAEILHM
jgi:hypothetical protein